MMTVLVVCVEVTISVSALLTLGLGLMMTVLVVCVEVTISVSMVNS